MATLYKTFKKTDVEFAEHLWGRRGDGSKAIPVKTYNLGTGEESVTFEIRPITEISRPGKFLFFASLIKLKSYILFLFPLFYVLTKNYLDNRIFDPLSMTLSAVASIFLFAGLNIRNDVFDHISGYDRVNISDHKPIQQGWITAHSAARLSWLFIGFAALLALPVCLLQPELLRVLAVVLVLFFIGRFASANSYKQQHFGEFVLFMLSGPALVSGYQVSMGSGVDTEVLAFGVLWGFAVYYLVQVNNFAHLLTSSQSGVSNSMTKLGFDRALKFLILAWAFYIFLWILFHYHYASTYWSVFGTMLLVFWSLPYFIKIASVKSPVGSGLKSIKREAYRTFLKMVFVFLIEYLWYLWYPQI